MALSHIDNFRRNALMTVGTGILAATIAFVPAAHAQDLTQNVKPLTVASAEIEQDYISPLEQAGKYGKLNSNNISIIIAYGLGNGVTPDEAGQYAIKKLSEYAEKQEKSFDAQYFILHGDSAEGISISYYVGAVEGEGPYDIREGVKPEILDKVFEKREQTAQLFAKASFSNPEVSN